MKILGEGRLSQSIPGTDRANLTFPSILNLSDGTLIATWHSGTTKDCLDENVEVSRSSDLGKTWSQPKRPFKLEKLRGICGTTKIVYLTELSPQKMIAAALWVYRETYPEADGLFNPDTEGCVPMFILVANSEDGGQTWSSWREVPMVASIGPASLTNPIMKMADGTLIMTIETNKHYLDTSQWFQRVVGLHSRDNGQTWSDPVNIGFDPTGRIFNWDLRSASSPDNKIGSFAWTFNTETESYLNIHRRISLDSGQNWSPAEDIGITDQPGHPAVLTDGKTVLPWVDRFNTHSIRARLAPSIDGLFDPNSEVVLYSHPTSTDDPKGALGFSVWTFGLPYAEPLSDGTVLIVYYAGIEQAMDIYWAKVSP